MQIDDFRLVPTTGLATCGTELRQLHDQLAAFELQRLRAKVDGQAKRDATVTRLADLLKIKDDAPPAAGQVAHLDADITTETNDRDTRAAKPQGSRHRFNVERSRRRGRLRG